MFPAFRSFLIVLGSIGIVAAIAYVFFATIPGMSSPTTQTAIISVAQETSNDESGGAPPQPSPVSETVVEVAAPGAHDVATIERIEDPYPFPPQSFGTIQSTAHAALVNIFCYSRNSGNIRPSSGSGVFIHQNGVILTNAHVAQYVLLAQSGEVDLSCIVRKGSPARPAWSVEVLYMPPAWVAEHASDITTSHPAGTGEHDYALLRITGRLADTVAAVSLPFDVREGIGFTGDEVLAASYPAEFIGSAGVLTDLYPISSVTAIGDLLTFGQGAVDLISIGGIIGAQSGSSGGPVVNAWGQLVGIIATASEGATTADRDLRALTISYIDRDLSLSTGLSLHQMISGDTTSRALQFYRDIGSSMVQTLLAVITTSARP